MVSVDESLLNVSIGAKRIRTSVRRLYGNKAWVRDLDIVNELGGHTGCVNALRYASADHTLDKMLIWGSWSKSGHLLASGSDDTHLNIWDYNPENIAKQFTLNTSVSTGHQANIFSVKFMPHSADRKVITCAGDAQVRVFDLEHEGTARVSNTDPAFSNTRSRRFNAFFPHARWLNETNTNARVYRSHADRAKRVVTESSPHLFLTCSEDGEVRQWDLRLPSSSYPAPRTRSGETVDVPPPLISYRKYALDLNSISCSGSQPQYIALGGAHLHCFLHDRRMLGRYHDDESGRPGSWLPRPNSAQDKEMGEATRCVRRFAPNEKRNMGSHDHGHITACKISDANPNELIASWSGEHIYSFDIVKSPDARDTELKREREVSSIRKRNGRDHKSKQVKRSDGADIALSKEHNDSLANEVRRSALRVLYENGQTEHIDLSVQSEDAGLPDLDTLEILLTDAQKTAERVAHSLVRLRKTLFDLDTTLRSSSTQSGAELEATEELTQHSRTLDDLLGQSVTLLPQLNDVMREWTYPVDPTEEEVSLQNTLRRNRQATWRLIQASGCVARVLGGRVRTASSDAILDPRMSMFDQVKPAALERRFISNESRFCYDFLKAILLWIEGGASSVLAAFKHSAGPYRESSRFPLFDTDGLDELPEKLKSYLLELADEDKPVIDIDANRFERAETRHIFQSQTQAVVAFTRALSGYKLRSQAGQTLGHADSTDTIGSIQILDRGAAARFWGIRVGRSLLMEAAEGVNFDFVNRAFGGLRMHHLTDVSNLERIRDEIDTNDDENMVEAIDLITANPESNGNRAPDDMVASPGESLHTAREAATASSAADVEMSTPPTAYVENAEDDMTDEHDENDEDFAEHNESDSNSDEDEDDEDEDDEDEDTAIHPLFRSRVAFGRSRQRAAVNSNVHYSSHTRVYKGHCNTRTVKEVNFYGLDDEYVVSGSDDGHFFIWDRKTTEVINILEGDGEVVNVVQGHPYEPIIACSGIDSTIKVFGPGTRERIDAENGADVANPGGDVHSSLRLGGRRARMARLNHDGDEADSGADNLTSRGLRSRKAIGKMYEIIGQNDVERRRGVGEAYLTVSPDDLFIRALMLGGTFFA